MLQLILRHSEIDMVHSNYYPHYPKVFTTSNIFGVVNNQLDTSSYSFRIDVGDLRGPMHNMQVSHNIRDQYS